MARKGQKVRIIKTVQGVSESLVGHTGTIIRQVHSTWWFVKLDIPVVINHVPYSGTIFPQTNFAAYLEILS